MHNANISHSVCIKKVSYSVHCSCFHEQFFPSLLNKVFWHGKIFSLLFLSLFFIEQLRSKKKSLAHLESRHRYDAKRMFISSSRVQPVRMSFAFFFLLAHSTSASIIWWWKFIQFQYWLKNIFHSLSLKNEKSEKNEIFHVKYVLWGCSGSTSRWILWIYL